MPTHLPTPRTVPALLNARAWIEPDRVALMLDDGRQLTYRQWDRRSDAVAYRLRERELPAGSRVALMFPASDWLDFAVAYCGVLKAGGVAVPLGPHLSTATVSRVLRQNEVVGVISGGSPRPDTAGWHAVLADLADDGCEAAPFAVLAQPNDTAQILYTSGTTGRSKAVAASHANLTHQLDPMARPRPLAHSTYCLHAFPLGTNAGQNMLLNALVAAPTTLIATAFSPDTFAALMERYRVGSVFLVPPTAVELAQARVHQRYDLASVRLLGSTGAALAPAVATRLAGMLPRATLTNCYTSTQAAPAELTMTFDPRRPGALGRPEHHGQLRVTRPDGRLTMVGETGLVWLRSTAPSRWYADDPAASLRDFVDGWVAMGDLGYVDIDGYLHLVDRVDDVVRSGALPVSTMRVEAALYEHPAVAAAAAVGVPHPVLGQVIAVAVVPAVGRRPVSDVNLRAFLSDRLDRHELPARIRYLDALPCNAVGKVLKTKLRDLLALGSDGPRPAPATDTEAKLAGLWSRLLGVTTISTTDDFFALGGDSPRAAQLAILASEEFGQPVPGTLAYHHGDLAGQAAWIDAARGRTERTDEATAAHLANPSRWLPLSGLQEQLLRWMHETDPPRDLAPRYVSVRITDSLDADVLASCLAQLVRRHEALHTCCVQGPDGWSGSVLDLPPPELVIRTATSDPAAAKVLTAEVSRPFAWGSGPLVRAVLVRTAPEEHLFALVIHHLAVDGWSFGILLRELGELYTARCSGTNAALRMPVQASEVISWNRARWPVHRAWWRAALHGAPARVEHFPGRRPARRYEAASEDLVLGDHLHAVARGYRTNAFVVAAAGWLEVLARHTGAAEFVVLTPVTGRALPEFESAVGCLAQPLLVRVPVGARPTLRGLLERLRDGLSAAMYRQAYPVSDFAAAIPFPVEIPFERWPGRTHFPGLLSQPYPVSDGLVWRWALPTEDHGVPKLELVEQPDGQLTGRLTYNRHAIDAQTVRLLRAVLLQALAFGAGHGTWN